VIAEKVFGEKTEMTRAEFVQALRGKIVESILDAH
jgi:hypothetical protein